MSSHFALYKVGVIFDKLLYICFCTTTSKSCSWNFLKRTSTQSLSVIVVFSVTEISEKLSVKKKQKTIYYWN